MHFPVFAELFRRAYEYQENREKGGGEPVVPRKQAVYNFFALYQPYVRVRDQVFGSTPLLLKCCPVVLEVRWRGQRIHYIACFPRLLCCYSQNNCRIVHSNQVCGVLLYYIKKRYHRRSRHNVAQMHGTIREDRISPVNPTWTGHRMVCNL